MKVITQFVLIFLDRCTEIEKANRILLEKMTNIMTSHPHITQTKRVPLNALNMSVDTSSRSKSLNRGVR